MRSRSASSIAFGLEGFEHLLVVHLQLLVLGSQLDVFLFECLHLEHVGGADFSSFEEPELALHFVKLLLLLFGQLVELNVLQGPLVLHSEF